MPTGCVHVIWTRPTRPALAPVSAAQVYAERFRLDERLAHARAADNDTARFAAGLHQEETHALI